MRCEVMNYKAPQVIDFRKIHHPRITQSNHGSGMYGMKPHLPPLLPLPHVLCRHSEIPPYPRASASHDNPVKIWDTNNGEYLQTLGGHRSWVWSVAFSHDSMRFASASDDNTIKIWNASSGKCLQMLSIGKPLYCILFDTTSSYLYAEISTIDISALSDSNPPLTISES